MSVLREMIRHMLIEQAGAVRAQAEALDLTWAMSDSFDHETALVAMDQHITTRGPVELNGIYILQEDGERYHGTPPYVITDIKPHFNGSRHDTAWPPHTDRNVLYNKLHAADRHFMRIVDDIRYVPMTPEWAASIAQSMGLNHDVIRMIRLDFRDRWNFAIDVNIEGMIAGSDFEDAIGNSNDGRLALGQSWEDVQYDIARKMQLPLEHPDVIHVFNTFYME